MTLTHAAKLGLVSRNTNVGTQKIDGSALGTYGMVIIGFFKISWEGFDSLRKLLCWLILASE